jgi:hypothetical protein
VYAGYVYLVFYDKVILVILNCERGLDLEL